MFVETSHFNFGLPKDSTKKSQDTILKVYLLVMLNTDFIEKDSELYRQLNDLAVIKKI